MSKFVLADISALVPGIGEEHKYLCECIDAIKANKDNVSILNDNLDAIKSLGDDFQVELSRIVNDVLRNTNRI